MSFIRLSFHDKDDHISVITAEFVQHHDDIIDIEIQCHSYNDFLRIEIQDEHVSGLHAPSGRSRHLSYIACPSHRLNIDCEEAQSFRPGQFGVEQLQVNLV